MKRHAACLRACAVQVTFIDKGKADPVFCGKFNCELIGEMYFASVKPGDIWFEVLFLHD